MSAGTRWDFQSQHNVSNCWHLYSAPSKVVAAATRVLEDRPEVAGKKVTRWLLHLLLAHFDELFRY